MFPKAYMGSRQVLRLPPAVPKQTCEVNFLPYLDMYAGPSSLSGVVMDCPLVQVILFIMVKAFCIYFTYLLQIFCILQLIFGLY